MNNKVHEGLAVDDTYSLRFFLATIGVEKAAGLGFGCWLEFNESRGKRRPYISLLVGKFHIQSGWLFDKQESHGLVEEAVNAHV